MTIGTFMGVGMLGLVAATAWGPRRPRLWLGLVMGSMGVWLAASAVVLATGWEWEWRSGVAVAGERLHLRLDAVGAWFLALVAVGGASGAAYARGYWPDDEHPREADRGRGWWGALLLSMGLVLINSNGLHFLMAWEAFALSGYFLITLDRDRQETRAAGWLYLVASHAGTLALFAFFALLASRTGSWELGPMRDDPRLGSLFWVALFGFGVKAGLFPLHVWLPSAHANAPSHVSAVLSGVAIKMGIFGLVRFGGWLPVPEGAGWAVMLLGAVSVVSGAVFALVQNDLKRLLAYCSVENVGVILIALGAGLSGAAQGDPGWGRVAMAGALLHIWNHGVMKSLLFFGAGSVVHATGTREMSRMGGLWGAMPWTAGLFALGSVAICALPPLNGFVSEWMIYLGLFDAAAGRAPRVAVIAPALLALGVGGALALAAFVKAGSVVFLGAARTQSAARAHECSPWMRVPMVALGAACAALALAPMVLWPAIQHALSSWIPGSVPVVAPASLAPLGLFQGVLAGLVILVVTVLGKRVRANGARRAPTWDCGYAAPTARMQYTGGSFSGLAVGWFAWLLRPERRIQWPRGVCPARASVVDSIPEAVLERVLGPGSAVVMMASAWVRQRQHGRLTDYILYLVAGLVGVGILVIWGSNR